MQAALTGKYQCKHRNGKHPDRSWCIWQIFECVDLGWLADPAYKSFEQICEKKIKHFGLWHWKTAFRKLNIGNIGDEKALANSYVYSPRKPVLLIGIWAARQLEPETVAEQETVFRKSLNNRWKNPAASAIGFHDGKVMLELTVNGNRMSAKVEEG